MTGSVQESAQPLGAVVDQFKLYKTTWEIYWLWKRFLPASRRILAEVTVAFYIAVTNRSYNFFLPFPTRN